MSIAAEPVSITDGAFVTCPAKPEWGLGKVLYTTDNINARVFFEFHGEATMRVDRLETGETPESHFVLDQVDRTHSLKGFRPMQDIEQSFLAKRKNGFDDAEYISTERDYKLKACEFFREHLDRPAFEAMIGAKQYDEVCKTALKVIGKTNFIFPQEATTLREAFKRGDAQKELFARALFNQLYGEDPQKQRFDSFIQMLTALGCCKWTLATYFPFLQDPQHQVFVKPTITLKSAEAFAYDLSFNPHPNWRIYERVRAFVAFVSDQLNTRQVLVPHDLLDVQTFIWSSQQQ
ncbi:DUF3553 domain-containing protein [Humidesulfovibrio idahonensis]